MTDQRPYVHYTFEVKHVTPASADDLLIRKADLENAIRGALAKHSGKTSVRTVWMQNRPEGAPRDWSS